MTSNQNFPRSLPTAGQGEQRAMVRGCKLQKLKEVAQDHKMSRRKMPRGNISLFIEVYC